MSKSRFCKMISKNLINLYLKKTDGDHKYSSCVHVCFKETKNSNSDYEWVCDMIKFLSKSALPGTSISEWNSTNIDTLYVCMNECLKNI